MKYEEDGVLIGIAWLFFCALATSFAGDINFHQKQNIQFSYSTGDIYCELPEWRFRQFLSNGKILNTKEYEEAKKNSPTSFPQNISKWQKDLVEEKKKNTQNASGLLKCQGVAIVDGTICFWRLINDWTLLLIDQNGRSIGIFENSDASGKHLNFWGIPQDFGDITVPAASEITLVSSEISPFVEVPMKLPIPAEVVLNFFRSGTVRKTEEFQFFQTEGSFPEPENLQKSVENLFGEAKELVESGGTPFIMRGNIEYTGALLTVGNEIFFWRVWSDQAMTVWNQTGAMRVLVLESGTD